jgi:hypothetical protein
MHVTVKTDPGRILGKRPNLSAQNSVADEIVTAFSTQSEPTIPLSALSPGKKSQRGGVIAATVLLFLPFVYPIVFFVHGAVTGHPLPALMYLYLVLLARLLSNAGGLVLYLSARKASFLQKPVGWTALAAFLLPIISAFLFGAQLYQVDSSAVSQVRGWLALGGVALSLVCMLALCVFCVLLLVRVFRKKKPDAVS